MIDVSTIVEIYKCMIYGNDKLEFLNALLF